MIKHLLPQYLGKALPEDSEDVKLEIKQKFPSRDIKSLRVCGLDYFLIFPAFIPSTLAIHFVFGIGLWKAVLSGSEPCAYQLLAVWLVSHSGT